MLPLAVASATTTWPLVALAAPALAASLGAVTNRQSDAPPPVQTITVAVTITTNPPEANSDLLALVRDRQMRAVLRFWKGRPHGARDGKTLEELDGRLQALLTLDTGAEYCVALELTVRHFRQPSQVGQACEVATPSLKELTVTAELYRFRVVAVKRGLVPFRLYMDPMHDPLSDARTRGESQYLMRRCVGQTGVNARPPGCDPPAAAEPILARSENDGELEFYYWQNAPFSLLLEDATSFAGIMTNDWSTFKSRSTPPIRLLGDKCKSATVEPIFQEIKIRTGERSCPP